MVTNTRKRQIKGPYNQVHEVTVREGGMCTCAVHCPENTYHEKACCQQVLCDCWCHLKESSRHD